MPKLVHFRILFEIFENVEGGGVQGCRKRLKQTVHRSPALSLDEEMDLEPEALTNQFEKSHILIGKNVNFANFTFDVPVFHIEEYFIKMGWVSIFTLEEHAYPRLIKDFYKDMVIVPRSDSISCLVKNVRVTVTKALIWDILELEAYDTQIFVHKAHLTMECYNPSDVCRCMMGKDFENITKMSANQLTLLCKILHNIIAHVILPRKGHRDEVNYFDLFILDSLIVSQKLDFPDYCIRSHETHTLSLHQKWAFATHKRQHLVVKCCERGLLQHFNK